MLASFLKVDSAGAVEEVEAVGGQVVAADQDPVGSVVVAALPQQSRSPKLPTY